MSDQANDLRSPIIASWVLLIATCLLAVIPGLGFLAWILGAGTVVIAIVLGIVVMAKGGTWSGVFILLASLIFVPIFIVFAPIISTLLTSVAIDARSEPGIEMIEESDSVIEATDVEMTDPDAATNAEPEVGESESATGDSDEASGDDDGEVGEERRFRRGILRQK